MIDYLTHPDFVNYNPSELPSRQGGGRMRTKTYRVVEALKDVYPRTRVICNSADIEADTVLIEPLDGIIYGLSRHKGRKILYCSELGLLRLPPKVRTQLLGAVNTVTANCRFQAKLFKYIDVNIGGILCDPIPDIFRRKSNYQDAPPRIVATGNVSWQKNAPQVTEVFKALKGIVERVYIGSASLWLDSLGVVKNLFEN